MFILRFLGTKDYSFASSKEILPYDTCDPVWKQKAAKADFRRGKIKQLVWVGKNGRFFIYSNGCLVERVKAREAPSNKLEVLYSSR